MTIKRDEGGKADFDYNTSQHRCAWETAGKRCFMPVGFSMGTIGKDKGYCAWHTGYLSVAPDILKHVDNPDIFDEWVDVHRQAYNHTYANCWICGYTKASLWRAVNGDYDDLKAEAEEMVFPDNLSDEAVDEYRELTQEINDRKHSPESWRVALAVLNEKWGVEMVIPPIPSGDRGKVVRVHEDREGLAVRSPHHFLSYRN